MGVNNFYGWAISQKFLVNDFEWITKVNEDLIKNYNEGSDERYFFEADVEYIEKLHGFHNDLPFLPERMKIEKVEKILANLHDKTKYVIQIRNLKQSLNHGLVFTKVHRVIKLNQNAWLKPYIDINTDLTKKKVKNDFEKHFFKLKNNAVFGKTTENVRKIEILNLSLKRRRNYLVSEPNYHTTKSSTENVLAIEMKKIKKQKCL